MKHQKRRRQSWYSQSVVLMSPLEPFYFTSRDSLQIESTKFNILRITVITFVFEKNLYKINCRPYCVLLGNISTIECIK